MNAPIRTQYLSRDDSDAALAEAIDARIIDLMASGAAFDPLEPSNFDEALSETLAAFPGPDLGRKLAICLRWGGDVRNMLTGMAHDYWEPKAEAQAEADLAAEIREAHLDARAEV